MGMLGAAYATALSLAVFNVVKWIFVWIKLKLQPFTAAFLKVILIGAIAVGINLLLPKIDLVIGDMLYRSAIISIAYLSMILITRTSPEVEKVVSTGLKWIRRR